MIFNPASRTRRLVGSLLAAGVIGGGAAGALSACNSSPAQPPAAVRAAASKSTVPKPLTRAESAAEDVIGFLEQGQPAKSRAEARILRGLAHRSAADALRQGSVSRAQLATFQQRADRTARLSLGGAPALQVSQAANSVSQLMPAFFARYRDPVPAAVLKLDYLDRQVQLDSQSGQTAKLRTTVRQLDVTWRGLRPQLARAGDRKVVQSYDQHVDALRRGGTAIAIRKQAIRGLDIVDQMEGVFLGK